MWEQNNAQSLVAYALNQYGSSIDVIFCNNDSMALGAYNAVEAAGLEVGEDLYLVGVDGIEDALRLIEEGDMTGTVINDVKGQAQAAYEAVLCFAEGKTNSYAKTVTYIDWKIVVCEE